MFLTTAMAICAISMDQRALELNSFADKHEWTKELPKGFFDKEPWEEGQEYE